MSKHTPGPWQWYWRVGEHLRADCGVFHEIREGQAVAVCRAPQYAGQRQWEADARLIAAAPELLALAKQYASECASCGVNAAWLENGKPCEECADIRAVINKAEGRCS